MKRIFVCSPYSGDVTANVKFAQEACLDVIRTGNAPYAPHLYLPQILDDNNEEERNTGINSGIAFLEMCDEVWVYLPKDTNISRGMRKEISIAIASAIPVVIRSCK
jgi:hypothetical protein